MASATRSKAGLAKGFLDTTKDSQEDNVASLRKIVEDQAAQIAALRARQAQLEARLAGLEAASRSVKTQLEETADQVKAQQGQVVAQQEEQVRRIERLEKDHEELARSSLRATVIVFKYAAVGQAPSEEAIRADLLKPTDLPPTEILSCVRLGTQGITQGAEAASAGGDPGSGAAVGAPASGGAPTPEASADASAAAPAATPGPGGSPPVHCFAYKVVLASSEAAHRLLIAKRAHRQLGTGIVVRQALTRRERAVQGAFMAQFRTLREAGVAVDFRRGRLFRRAGGKWEALPVPQRVR